MACAEAPTAGGLTAAVADQTHPYGGEGNALPPTSESGLAAIADAMHRISVSDDAVGQAAEHHLSAGGKQLRALLTLDTISAAGETLESEGTTWASAAVELVHQASLVHDDLMDNDSERRGDNTAWHANGDGIAILLGDHFLAAAFEAGARTNRPAAVVRHLAAAIRDATAGQAQEIQTDATRITDPVRHYERRARAKSGRLMALPVEIGLVVTGAEQEHLATTRTAWGALGAAYQIGDDLAELEGRKDGRDRQSDLIERRLNAPVAHFLASTETRSAGALRDFLRGPQGREAEIDAWRTKLLNSPAPTLCREHQHRLVREAREAIASLPASNASLLERTIECIGLPARDPLTDENR